MAFNPMLETNIQPTQTAQQPSAAGAALGLLGGLFPARAAPPTVSRTDVEATAHQNTLRELSIAAQTGDATKANSIYRGHASQFGVGTSPEIDAAFTAITNQNPTIATYGGDNSVAAIETNPNYPLYLEMARGANPSASPDQLRTEALGMTSAKMANEAKLLGIKDNATITWSQAQPEYDKGFNIALTELGSMITQYNNDDVITPEEAGLIRSYFNGAASKFTAPPGVDAATFEAYRKDKWDNLTNLVDMQLNSILSDGPSKDMQKAVKSIIDKLTVQGRLSPMTEYAINGGGANADAVASILNIYKGNEENPEWTDTMKQINSLSFEELVEYSKSFEEIGPEALAGKVNLTDWRKQGDSAIVTSLTTADKPMIMSADPMQAALGVQATMEKVAALGYTSLDGPLLAGTFDSAYFAAIERITDKNPSLGAYYIERTNEVLGNQKAALLTNINRVANANGFKIQTVNGRSDFFPDATLLSDAAKRELDTYFGDDIYRAWAANGIVSAGRGGNVTQNLTSSFTAIKGLQTSLDTYSAVLAAGDRLNGRLPKQPGEEQQQASGSAGLSGTNVVEAGAGYTVIKLSDGSTVRREGTRAWRNNNPGNIEYGAFAKSNGAIGTDGRFAVFPTVEDGRRARASLLFESPSYKNLTIGAAIARYAPSFENDTNAYTGAITSALGLPSSTKLSDLTPDQKAVMQNAMERVEGFTPGKENGVQAYDTAQENPRTSMSGTAATGPMFPPLPTGPTETTSTSPSPAPVVAGTSFQPTPMATPVETPQVVNSNPEAAPQAATPTTTDPAIAEFIEGLKKGRQEFTSMEEVQAAKAAGTLKEGDIVFVAGRPVLVQ